MSVIDWVLIGFAVAVFVFIDLIAIAFYLLYKDHEKARMDWERKERLAQEK